ncbi:ATPase [Arachidicoccus ginsenosidimutans]|uniref:SRPBCC family protein n=1 Tax=Arachidicoccus sp. BS20 TaxID=1850526 RepID=UPI0007F1227C|nr:SRPBCC domain-containing protein [Arachidicoccus sp. BS20]ANI87957.1 ATPase [Arachidicoccus sp. BS20]
MKAVKNFIYAFETSKTSEEVFQLLLNVEKWWFGLYEETINGASQKLNDEFTFHAGGGAHYSKQKLMELVPNAKIVWLVTDSKFTFVGDEKEWVGTKICFDIIPEGKKTKVVFTHEGLTPEMECYKDCSFGWTSYLDKLKRELQ